MLSRAFFIVFPMAVIFAIIAVSAIADEKQPPEDYRAAIERQHVEDIAEPDMPDPVAAPEQPSPNAKVRAAAPPPMHEHKMEAYAAATLVANITPATVEKGTAAQVTLTLVDKDKKPVSIDALTERHTKRIHLLVVDDSLTDYQHIHPDAGNEPGTYTFSFTPLSAHNYRVFADVKVAGEAPQMVQATLTGKEKCADPCVDKASVERAAFGNYTAILALPGELKAGTAVRGDVFITDADNAPFEKLEPVMGAYGHIVGFNEADGTVAHVHPMGKEPASDADRGSSPIAFMLHPETAGFVKLFVQIRVDGKDVFLPFGIFIDP